MQNQLGQNIGQPIPDWTPRARPSAQPMTGHFCRIETLDPARHADDLFAAFTLDRSGANWTYLPYEPWPTQADMLKWMSATCLGEDPLFYTVIDSPRNRAAGIAALMRIDPNNGVIEVGHIHFSPLLQRKPAATEAIYLLMRRVFDELGYRRFEWKCDALNAPSRDAALRFGFQYEGLFRQAVVYKGRNRDTAWFAMTDQDWPRAKMAFERWLDPVNFDTQGQQRERLRRI